MKNVRTFYYLLIGILACLWAGALYAQIDELHGDEANSAFGLYSGNQIRTHFWNDGQIGIRRSVADQIGGEWPINSGRQLLAKWATNVVSEVRGTDGMLRHISSESNGTRTAENDCSAGDYNPDTGDWWTFTPLPGFHNPSPPSSESAQPQIAMSHRPWSWPANWPDRFDDMVDPGWPGSWNGFFGKGLRNADQESYYVMDDYKNEEFPFYPDSTDLNRRGLGLRASVRGFQWSHIVVEDVLFWLWDVTNIGTHLHDKMVFGVNSGPNVGGDSADDGGKYDLDLNFGWHYDGDGIGGDGHVPAGMIGLAFFESPGNPFDGIDNDGDAADGPGPVITEDMFLPRTVNVGDPIVVINYDTFERTLSNMPAEGQTINYLDREITIAPGDLEEIQNNLIDDNLNGLIDENNGSVFGEGETAQEFRLFLGRKYIDYLNNNGSTGNLLIDERRDDGIDNDGDWDIRFDDVGIDGVAGTGDFGEGDGMPTSGVGTLLPGEPHIDKTDIDESDMIGLTSFNIYIYPDFCLQDDEDVWESVLPGYLNALGQIANTDIILGSGYFPLKPGDTERFSMGYIMGDPDFPGAEDGADLVRNKQNAEAAYLANYNFAQAPIIPTVRAYAEDGRVRLFWDDVAEGSFDPLTQTNDFEGYKIYRSTDAQWNDMPKVSDGRGGSTSAREPVAQFDLVDDITGFHSATANGLSFYLGDDTGITHTWVDSNVTNGQRYFYAVTAYDFGSDSLGLFPSETSRFIAVNRDDSIDRGRNVVVVRPEAPVAGYVGPQIESTWLPGSKTNGTANIPILDKTAVEDRTYRIVFRDTTLSASLWNYPATRDFSLVDVTNSSSPDTLIKNSADFGSLVSVPGVNAFELLLENAGSLLGTAPSANLNADSTGWSREGIFGATFRAAFFVVSGDRITGVPTANDYRIEVGEPGSGTSTEFLGFPAVDVNFNIINASTEQEVQFIFEERDGENGRLTAYTGADGRFSDRIYFLEEDDNGELMVTWHFELSRAGSDSTTQSPASGDIFNAVLEKPFLSHDVLEFTTTAATVDNELAKSEMDDIKVVPNPYIAANSWEPENLYTTGRGPRELHFTNLPPACTIRIFNVRGQLVQTLEHDSGVTNENNTFWNGAVSWNMLSKDGLDIAFGVYIYHVEAPGVGNKIGKFAVIK